jgi:hypothetical protein
MREDTREYTAREMAAALLAMPDPDSVLSIRVVHWSGRLIAQDLVQFAVVQGLEDRDLYFLRDPAAHWIEIIAETEPRSQDLHLPPS